MASPTSQSHLDRIIATLKKATQNPSVPSLSESAASALDAHRIAQGLKYNKKVYRLVENACGLVYGVVCTVSTDSVSQSPSAESYHQSLDELSRLLAKFKDYVQEETSRIKIIAKWSTNADTISSFHDDLSRFMWTFKLKTDDNYQNDGTWIDLVIAEVPKKQKEWQLKKQQDERMAVNQDVQRQPEYTTPQTDPHTAAAGGERKVYLSNPKNYKYPASPSDEFTFVGGNSDSYTNSILNTNSGNTTITIISDSYNDSSAHVKIPSD